MNAKLTLLSLLTITLSLTGFTQKNTAHSNLPIKATNFYYKDGVKMSLKHNTPILFSNINDKTFGNSPTEMALNWIKDNQTDLEIKSIENLTLSFKRSGLAGHTIRFQQNINGVAVLDAQIAVHISPKNNVTYVENLYDPNIDQIKTQPTLTKSEAFNIALTRIHSKGRISYSSNDLMVYNQKELTQLIYKVIIESDLPIGSWEILVNAQNVTVISAKDVSY
jgi:Zn-dependent metalloprotease